MKKFIPEFEGTPSVRMGPRIPEDGVGLVYVNSPPFTADKIEVLDLSRRIPENVSLQHDVETDLFVGSDRLLKDPEGRSSLPLEELIVTNEYLEQDGRMIPLFWKATSRYFHYEAGIAEGDYTGDKISITLGGQKVEEPHRIRLVATGTPYVFKVEVLCGFRIEEGKDYRLHYHRCDKNGKNMVPGHSEILNTVPLFTMVSREEVMGSPLGARIYSVTLDHTEGGFQIHVPSESRMITRSPIWIRWRVRGNDGKVSPWFSDMLFHRNSLHPEEMASYGQQVYIDEPPRAYKILCPNVVSLLGHTSVMTYQFEYQVWDGSSWKQDNGQIHMRLVPLVSSEVDLVRYQVAQGKLYGYRLEAAVVNPTTGNADLTPGVRGFQSVPVSFQLKVSAVEDRPGTAPQVIREDVAKTAYASWDLNTSLFPTYTSPQRAVDGLVPLNILSVLLGSFKSTSTSAYAYSAEQQNPSTNITTLTLELPQARALQKLKIYFGNYGKPEWARIEHDGNTITLWDASSIPLAKQVNMGDAKRVYEYAFNEPTMAKRIRIGIRPDKWFVRPVYRTVWLILFTLKFFSHNLYKSGFEVIDIQALEFRQVPGYTPWSAENQMSGVTLYQAPFRMSARELVEALELLPPQNADLNTVRYRIELVNPDHRANLHVHKNGKLLLDSDGAYVIDYKDLDQAVVEITTPDYELALSPRYSVRTDDPGTLFVLPPADVEADSVWRVRVNNGRIRIRDYIAGYLKEYFLPEFYRQAFDPHPPFRRVFGEEPIFESRTRIRVRYAPLHVETDDEGRPTNLSVRLKGEPIPVSDWNSATGQIYLARRVEFTDDLEVDYTYWVQYVEYGGYEENGTFYHLDLCPHPGRTYTDLETKEERPTSELLEKDIYLYCLPVYKRPLSMDEPASGGGEVKVNLNPLRHLIVPKGTSESEVLQRIRSIDPDALLLARIGVGRPYLPENVEVIDVRRRGGGISVILSDEAALRTYPQAEAFWDFGFWDGRPYPSNSILIVTVHEDALKNTSEREVREFLERIVDLGVYPVLRFKSSQGGS